MKTILIISSLLVLAYASPLYKYDDYKTVNSQIFGLGGGIEHEEHEPEYKIKGYESEPKYYVQHEEHEPEYKINGYEYEPKQYEQTYKKYHDSVGFTGSDFKTPVDVHHEKKIYIQAKPEYHFEYKVADDKEKDYKNQHESRDGSKVKGTYSLLEPDHKTVRVVDYVSDKKLGFIAKVSYKKIY